MSCLYPGARYNHSFDQEVYEGAVLMFPSVTRDLGRGVQSRPWGRNVSSVASKATNNPCLATYQCYNSSLLRGRKKGRGASGLLSNSEECVQSRKVE